MNRRSLIVLLWLIPIIAVGATFWRLTFPAAPREVSPPVEFFIVSGIVKNGTENPLAGAEVSVGGFKVLTRADGSYTILGVRPGTWTLKVSMEGYEAHEESITVKEDLTMNVVLTPPPPPPPPPPPGPATITGKVIDVKTGLPVAGATVTVDGYKVTTGPDGVYSLSVDVGTYNLTVSMKGYETKTVSVDASEEKTYTVDVSITSILLPTITITADPNLITAVGGKTMITAVVKDSTGAPIAGVTVSFISSGASGEFDSPTAVTDANGVARVTWTSTAVPMPHGSVLITVSVTVDDQKIEGAVGVTVSPPCSTCHE